MRSSSDSVVDSCAFTSLHYIHMYHVIDNLYISNNNTYTDTQALCFVPLFACYTRSDWWHLTLYRFFWAEPKTPTNSSHTHSYSETLHFASAQHLRSRHIHIYASLVFYVHCAYVSTATRLVLLARQSPQEHHENVTNGKPFFLNHVYDHWLQQSGIDYHSNTR
jgi:hypothetical protein